MVALEGDPPQLQLGSPPGYQCPLEVKLTKSKDQEEVVQEIQILAVPVLIPLCFQLVEYQAGQEEHREEELGELDVPSGQVLQTLQPIQVGQGIIQGLVVVEAEEDLFLKVQLVVEVEVAEEMRETQVVLGLQTQVKRQPLLHTTVCQYHRVLLYQLLLEVQLEVRL